MKSDDLGSDLDDLPLSSLGMKTSKAQKTNHKDKKTGKNGTSSDTKKPESAKKGDKKSSKKPEDAKAEKAKKDVTIVNKKKEKASSPKRKGTAMSPAFKNAKSQLKEKKTRQPEKGKKKNAKKSSKADEPLNSVATLNTVITASAELYSKCDKGKLIQNVLCRWWYCYSWPDPSVLPSKTPTCCDALDGFPGVYVVTSGPNVGRINDYRNHDKAPNFNNFSKMSADELKTLLAEAIQKQKVELIDAEGSGTETEENLNELQKWASKINGPKADKEAEKILRAIILKP